MLEREKKRLEAEIAYGQVGGNSDQTARLKELEAEKRKLEALEVDLKTKLGLARKRLIDNDTLQDAVGALTARNEGLVKINGETALSNGSSSASQE
jgi:hypothetical protein